MPAGLDPYFWFGVAVVLAMAELALPGFFLLWLGVAAGITGIIHILMPMGWQTEVIIFILVSAALVAATWRMVTQTWNAKTDAPHLNQRHAGLVGRNFALQQAIQNGRGKIKFEDTLWDVEGPDLAQGTMVQVTGVVGLGLKVEKA